MTLYPSNCHQVSLVFSSTREDRETKISQSVPCARRPCTCSRVPSLCLHVCCLQLVAIYNYPCLSIATTIRRGLTQSIMGARQWHLRLARDSADSVWPRPHYHLPHAPPRPHTYPSTHTTPVYTTSLDYTLKLSTRHVREICKIVSPRYSSQSNQHRLTHSWSAECEFPTLALYQ